MVHLTLRTSNSYFIALFGKQSLELREAVAKFDLYWLHHWLEEIYRYIINIFTIEGLCVTTAITATTFGFYLPAHFSSLGRYTTLCLKKNRTPDTFSNNSNNPILISTKFGIKNRQLIGT